MIELLSIEDSLLKFSMYNKNFYNIVQKLKTFKKLWKIKFL